MINKINFLIRNKRINYLFNFENNKNQNFNYLQNNSSNL